MDSKGDERVELPETAQELIRSGRLAHLVTLNDDGSPQVSIVWTTLEDGELVTAHLGAYRKVENVRRDPRVVISMEAEGANPIGMQNHMIVYGRARVVEGGAPAMLQRMAAAYIGPGVTFPPMPNPPEGDLLRITPERIGGMGPWAERPGSEAEARAE
jgi:PPOX class probable F420-dependent enzyme